MINSQFHFAKYVANAKKNSSDFHSKTILDVKIINHLFFVVMSNSLTEFRRILGYFSPKTGLESMIW